MGDPSEQASFAFPQPRRVWTVSAVLAKLKDGLEREFFDVWIEGEISNFHQAASRHCYFTLKDGHAQLRAAMFAAQARYLKFKLHDGLQVIVRGRLSVYEARGELQCYVEHVEPMGRGGLQLAFEQLKDKLAAEGLFLPERKRPLPLLPRRIGVITSPRGAAVADIIHTLTRRFPGLAVRLYPVAVQGDAAAGEICAALDYFAAQSPGTPGWVDVVILARGGGSLEDLWPFNEEAVARAIARLPMPLISGVGHETDFTIADFVADLRAPTPTAAAELAIRPRADWERELAASARHLHQCMRYRLLRRRQRIEDWAAHRAFHALRQKLARRAQLTDELSYRLSALVQRRLHASRERLAAAAARVHHRDVRAAVRQTRTLVETAERSLAAAWKLRQTTRRHQLDSLATLLAERNPLHLLERGYTLVYDAHGALATRPDAFADGDPLRIRFASGWLDAQARRHKG